MAKFLHSRAGTLASDEILDQNILTPTHLRSLIAGDFFLEYMGDDFLLLHEKGIFLLRQCHANGVVSGEADAPQWVDRNYLGEGTDFPNPIVACRRGIEKLIRILKLPPEHFRACVVFDVQCELRQVPSDIPRFDFLRVDQLEDFFAQLFPRLSVRYSHTQLDALHDIFLLVSAQE